MHQKPVTSYDKYCSLQYKTYSNWAGPFKLCAKADFFLHAASGGKHFAIASPEKSRRSR